MDEWQFHAALRRECRRTERSEKPFLLAIAWPENAFAGEVSKDDLPEIASVLAAAVRETDIVGWYEEGESLGVVFTELRQSEKKVALDCLKQKLDAILCAADRQIGISLHFFPDDGNAAPLLKAGLHRNPNSAAYVVKRIIDIVGSLVGLLLLSPLLLVTGILIKLTSAGPVLFRQTRLGQYGKEFLFLKFRSMYVDSDAALHKEYVSHFIAGKAQPKESRNGKTDTYKVINDPRVTPLGRVLRKTSIDELPQLLNVLKGEMSLVGPRPPLPYEHACYNVWHLRRISEVKPGITGLWQVCGRSTTTFDEMVRLDLQYAKQWSISLDTRILLRTFRVVLSCEGAY